MTDLAPPAWDVRACQCDFCRRHGAACTTDAAGRVQFEVGDRAALRLYRFAAKTADFVVCRGCGVYLGAVLRADGSAFATLNTRCLDRADLPPPRPVSYLAEDAQARVARRVARWTPVDGDALWNPAAAPTPAG